MKKIISLALSLVMLLSMSVSAFAAETEPYNTVVLKDTEAVHISQTSDDNFTYIATYDKVNNTVQLVQTDNVTGEENVGEVAQIQTLTTDNAPQARASLEEKTFTNYEYEKTYGTPNKWELRRPGDNAFDWIYFQTYETSKNKEYLTAFKDAVDDINVQEGTLVTSLGMAGLSYLAAGAAGAGAIFTGGTLSAAAWGALLSAGGFSTAYVATCMAYDQSCKDAYDAYWETYNHSSIL